VASFLGHPVTIVITIGLSNAREIYVYSLITQKVKGRPIVGLVALLVI